MLSIPENSQKKLEELFLKKAKEWANVLNVKHKGLDVWELLTSFEKNEYQLDWTQIDSKIVFCVVNLKTGKNVFDGIVFLSPDPLSDAVFYEDVISMIEKEMS